MLFKRSKKALALILTLVMLLGLLPYSAIAADDENLSAAETIISSESPATPSLPEETSVPEESSIPEDPSDVVVPEVPSIPEESPVPEVTPAEEPTPETAFPAISGYASAKGVTVFVDAPEGAFPEGTALTITPITLFHNFLGIPMGKVEGAVADALADEIAEPQGAVAFDITFTGPGGEELQPAEGYPVSVVFSVETASALISDEASQLQVFHMEDVNSEATPVGEPVNVDLGAETQDVSVMAESFSVYVVSSLDNATKVSDLDGLSLHVGNTLYIYSDVGNGQIGSRSWLSNNTSVATVTAKGTDNTAKHWATLKAVGIGTATISFGNGQSATITVVGPTVTITQSTTTNTTVQLNATPSNFSAAPTITWSVSGTNGTIDANGLFTWKSGISSGSTATVTASAKNGTETATTTYTLTYQTYSVTFSKNGGSGTAPANSGPFWYGDLVTVPGSNGLTLSGYEFVGWGSSASNTSDNTLYLPGDQFVITGNTTLYARWMATNATVNHVDIRVENVTFSQTTIIKDQNGNTISSTTSRFTGTVTAVDHVVIKFSNGTTHTSSNYSIVSGYEFRAGTNQTFARTAIGNVTGVTAYVTITGTDGTVYPNVEVSFTEAQRKAGWVNCDGGSSSKGMDLSVSGLTTTVESTQTLTAALNVTKAFSGLSEAEIATLSSSFSITVTGFSKVITLRLSDLTSRQEQFISGTNTVITFTKTNGVYQWTFSNLPTGSYAITEAGYSNATLNNLYTITTSADGASGAVSTTENVTTTGGTQTTSFVNNYAEKATSVSGAKTWTREGYTGNLPSITITLYANDVALNNAPTWNGSNYTFSDLPKYASGSLINYTVAETAISGATLTGNRFVVYEAGSTAEKGYWLSSQNGYNFTNTWVAAGNENQDASFTIYKKADDNGGGGPLAGAVFQLYSSYVMGSADNATVGNAVTTASDGYASVTIPGSALPTGSTTATFYLVEESAPGGYARSSTIWTVTANRNGIVTVRAPESGNIFTNIWGWIVENITGGTGGSWDGNTLTIVNTREMGTIRINKVVNGVAPSGSFTFYVKTGSTVVDTLTVNAGSGWTATSKALPTGTYSIEESAADIPDYTLSSVSWSNGNTGASTSVNLSTSNAALTATNAYTRNMGTLIVTKAFGVNSTNVMPNDALFTVYSGGSNGNGGTFYASFTYGQMTNGSMTLTGVPTGSYYVEESNFAVTSYTNTPTGVNVPHLVTKNGSTNITITNQYEKNMGADIKTPVELTIKKVDGADISKALPGATFLLTKNGESTGTQYTTQADGTVKITFGQTGTYTLKETAAPERYVTPANLSYTVTVNSSTDYTVELKDDNFWHNIYNLILGVDPSEGYNSTNNTLTVKNEQIKGSITVTKTVTGVTTDKEFTFALYDENSALVGTAFTLKSGASKTFSDLPYGTYTIQETGNTSVTDYTFNGVTYNGTTAANGYQASINTQGQQLNVTATNSYTHETGSLSISKTVVTAPNSVAPNSGDSFTFTVTFGGTLYSGSYTVGTAPHTAIDGVITLKAGETATINGVDTQKAYAVTEAEKANYTADSLTQRGTLAANSSAVFTNTYFKSTITGFTVTKVWNHGTAPYVNPSATDAEVQITLQKKVGSNGTWQDVEAKTTSGLTYTWGNLDAYQDTSTPISYQAVETNVPTGYKVSYSDNHSVITNTYDPTIEVGVENKASFTIHKVDSTSNDLSLKGAVFQLYTSYSDETLGGALFESPLVTGEDGTVTVNIPDSALPAEGTSATFYLAEVTAPNGYTKDDTVWTVTASKSQVRVEGPVNGNVFTNIWAWIVDSITGGNDWNNSNNTLTVKNSRVTGEATTPASIHILKSDGTSPIWGISPETKATFTLTLDNAAVNSKTDENGVAAFSSIDGIGDYTLRETDAPDAYTASAATWYVRVTNGTSSSGWNSDHSKWITTTPLVATIYTDSDYTEKAPLNGLGQLVVANTRTPAAPFTITKVWNDADYVSSRPNSVTINISSGETALGAVTLSETDATTASTAFTVTPGEAHWTAVVSGLPAKGAVTGADIAYRVEEAVNGAYSVAYTNSGTVNDNAVTVTNTRTSQTTAQVSGEKLWIDGNDRDGIRPDYVKIQLYANGTGMTGDEYVKVLDKTAGWKYNWTDLPDSSGGTEIKYTVREIAMGYYDDAATAEVDEARETAITYSPETGLYSSAYGYQPQNTGTSNITNTYDSETISIPVIKTWSGNYSSLPSSIELELYADGVATGLTLTMTSANQDGDSTKRWIGEFGSSITPVALSENDESPNYTIYKYREGSKGVEIVYSVKETKIAGNAVTGSTYGNWTITISKDTSGALTVGNNYYYSGGTGPNPKPTPKPTPAPTPTPTPTPSPTPNDEDIGDEDVPLGSQPDDNTQPDAEIEIVEGVTPLGNLPQTGMVAQPANPTITLGLLALALSMAAAGLAITFSRKKEDEEG